MTGDGRNDVTIEMLDGVAILRLNRPPANAIDIGFADRLGEAVAALSGKKDLRALVLTGTGACFSAGLDLKLVPSYGAEEQRRMVTTFNHLVTTLYSFPHPTVAALNGHTVAGGLVLALTCDYRIATENPCTFGLTESRVGIPFPTAAITVVKAELTPTAARSLVLMGRKAGASEMLALGVIDEISAGDRLLTRALDVARDAGRMPQGSYMRIKMQLRGAALEQIEKVLGSGGDPALQSWLTPETAAAAARILSGKEEI